MTNGGFTPEQDNNKTNVEPVHSYDAFHTGPATTGVKGIMIIGMHRFNICLVVVLSLSCSGVKTPLDCEIITCTYNINLSFFHGVFMNSCHGFILLGCDFLYLQDHNFFFISIMFYIIKVLYSVLIAI